MLSRPTPACFLAADLGAGSGSGSGSGSGADRTDQTGEPAQPNLTGQKAEPGMVLGGRYQLVSPIAAGGMAQVWRAQDLSLVRQVAIKILHPHLATDEAFVARFRREAVASARLSHRSIVAVYDTLSEGGLEAIVMELIEGRTLRAVLDEAGYLPPADVVDVGMQISAALDEAHRAGIVHRDIKPANIMVGADRRIMVTDFGIAKAQKDADLTHTGTLLGTAKYLAPEQVAGEPVDPRADIYALGIVLFEAATGKAPFQAETDAGTALARLQGEVPRCRHRRSSVPVGLDEAIARAMARNPDDRYERASNLQSALAVIDLSDVRSDTSDLGPALGATAAMSGSTAGVPVAPPIAPPPNAPVPNPGTAVLTPPVGPSTRQQDRPSQPVDRQQPNRKQRKADKKSAKKAGRSQKPSSGPLPIEGKQRPTKTIAVALIIGGLIVSGLLLASLLAPETGIDPVAGAVPTMTLAEAFDPRGDGQERNDSAVNAIDGNPDTLWRTDTYRRAGLGGLKPGVGLIITLDGESTLDEIELLTANKGWRAEIYVGSEFGPNDGGFDTGTLDAPAGVVENGGASEVVSLNGATGSRILLWITETGTTPDRNQVDVFRFVLFEVSLR